MSKQYEKLVALSAEPDNRIHNRRAALRLYKQGLSAQSIAEEYPTIWRLTPEGKLKHTPEGGRCRMIV